ncbi:39S ribosomal protein L33, mitochondrial [Geodia barretti]|uniref:Large ribosomal subunit protein bL33m n=2 Tax=Geodia barretti TaxID=519541 RepID=A0AA35R709_GEOBA|nr:39S ribosomal protein L33, mitochondrial [Geodia barretti]
MQCASNREDATLTFGARELNENSSYGQRKSKRMIVARLVSAAGTGFFYTVRKPRLKERMTLRKYDPVVRQHVLFVEQKKK